MSMTVTKARDLTVAGRVAGGTTNPKRMVKNLRTGKDAYGYVRVSTNEKKQLSIPGQKSLIVKQAAKDGRRIVKWYKDERSRGVRREGLRSMLADMATAPSVGAIYIWQDSRLWGHVEQQRFILARCRLEGVRVIDSKGRLWKDDTPLDKLSNLVSAGVTEVETGNTAVRVYDTAKEKVEKDGALVSRPPYGIGVRKVVRRDPQTKQPMVTSEWHVDKGQMEIVRLAFELADLGVSRRRIALRFVEDGVDPEKPWNVTLVTRVLDNQLYIGEVVWNRRKTEWVIDRETGDKIREIHWRNRDEVIVSAKPSPLGCVLAEDPSDPRQVRAAKDLFWRVQDRLKDDTGRERVKRKFPQRVLYGLVRCDRCGKAMTAVRMSHRSRRTGERSERFTWQCAGRPDAGYCSKTHTYSEALVYQRVEELLAGFADVEGIVRIAQSRRPSETAEDLIKALRASVAAREQVVEKLKAQNRLPEGECPFDSHVEFMAELRPAKAAVKDAKADLAALEKDAGPIMPREEPPLSAQTRGLLLEGLDLLQDESISLGARQEVARLLILEVRLDNPCITVVIREDRVRHAARDVALILERAV
jgi:DNA invertase Pin-like site-specific DNA recombinase